MTRQYKLRYPSVAKCYTENRIYVREVFYTDEKQNKIGSVKTYYHDDKKNEIQCYDAAGNRLEADVDGAFEGRQFIIDRYEYAIQQRQEASRDVAVNIDSEKLNEMKAYMLNPVENFDKIVHGMSSLLTLLSRFVKEETSGVPA